MIQTITILGSTSSIGVSTLDVVARHLDKYKVFALTAHTRVAELAQQCVQFQPEIAVVGSAQAASELSKLLKERHLSTQVTYGDAALREVATRADIVMAAIVGAAGLVPTLAAAQAGKKVLLANKEALVMSGQLFMDAIAEHHAQLLPIDSEHNAIFQCLPRDYAPHNKTSHPSGVAQILLTASGGPFLTRSLDSLSDVTPEQAVAHPNWVMGKKISVDSATMMNKGLEVIEAHWLFGVPAEKIQVVIHPQSVIHSMVSYVDGSILAQLGNPDMRTPIAYGLAYPERIDSGVKQLDMTQIARLDFQAPDFNRFPCLAIAFDALRTGGTAATLMNAANEVAVQAFLDRKISFLAISDVIRHVLDALPNTHAVDLETVLEQDRLARQHAHDLVQKYRVN